jgi:hypothetical protein
MHLVRRPFRWPRWCAGAIQTALSDAACPGLLQKPLDTGHRHQATTCSVSPQRPPEQQANKQQSTNTPKKVAMLMAVAVRRYNTAHIAQWRSSRDLLEATGCCHRASIMSNNINWTWLRRVFSMFSSSIQ